MKFQILFIICVILVSIPMDVASARQPEVESGWVELVYSPDPISETPPGGSDISIQLYLHGGEAGAYFEWVQVDGIAIQNYWMTGCYPNHPRGGWKIEPNAVYDCGFTVRIVGNGGEPGEFDLLYKIEGQDPIQETIAFVFQDWPSGFVLRINHPSAVYLQPLQTSGTFTVTSIVNVLNYSYTDEIRPTGISLGDGVVAQDCTSLLGLGIAPGSSAFCHVDYQFIGQAYEQFRFDVEVDVEDDDGYNLGDVTQDQYLGIVLVYPGATSIWLQAEADPVAVNRAGEMVTVTLKVEYPGAGGYYRLETLNGPAGEDLTEVCGFPEEGYIVSPSHDFICSFPVFVAAPPRVYYAEYGFSVGGSAFDGTMTLPASGEANVYIDVTNPYQYGMYLPLAPINR
jgi:hypothetical protein